MLDCAPQALNFLYNGEFMPFVVVVAPPELEELRQINKVRSNPFTNEELEMTIAENKKLVTGDFAKMFHLILTNRNTEVTFRRLVLRICAFR